MPLASPNSLSASCSAPASFSESSIPKTVTDPALPGPGVGGSVVVVPPDAVVVVAPDALVVVGASVSPSSVVSDASDAVVVVAAPLVAGACVALESSSSDVLHAAASIAIETDTTASRVQVLLIGPPFAVASSATSRDAPGGCKRLQVRSGRS